MWLPFSTTMKRLNEYDITKQNQIELPADTGVTEFNELNTVAVNLITKNRQAYHHQKQFVENASHEIQTPLAIIRSKLELLIDQPDITEKVASLLADITEANERLSQMNRNLLLLAKIENNQFPEKIPVNVSALLERIITTYQEHYAEQFPVVVKSVQPGVFINVNPSLGEILFNNLVKNAVIHNITGGYFKVELDNNFFKILNSGKRIVVAPGLLFERFSKGSEEVKSTGLGLALVKQICQLYNFKIDYTYTGEEHAITIDFRQL